MAFRSGDADNDPVGSKIADSIWAVYASRSYIARQRHGKPDRIEDLSRNPLVKRMSCWPTKPTINDYDRFLAWRPINAMTIPAVAGDLRQFRHHRRLLKFCASTWATRQSDQFRGQIALGRTLTPVEENLSGRSEANRSLVCKRVFDPGL